MFSYENKKCADKRKDRHIPTVLSFGTSNLKMADIYICHCSSTGAWRVSHSPLRCCSFPCAFDVNTWQTHLLACHQAPSPFPSRQSCAPSGCGMRKKRKADRQDARNVLLLSSSVGLTESLFFLNEQNLWKLSPDFTPGMMELINLPGQDHVLTTGSVLSQWDL